jgi:hypothetical protein
LSARLAAASDATLRIRVYPVRSVSEAPLGAAFNVSLLH